MERGSKVIAMVALLIGVVGLTLGFAAFSNTLTIKSSATVVPNATEFNVDLSGVETGDITTSVAPTTSSEAVTATTAAIDNGGTNAAEISNLSATFTEPGQSATYTFYARNIGEYTAYLNTITFSEVSDGANKVCTAGVTGGENPADQDLVDEACDYISVKVEVGSLEATGSMDNAAIGSHSLAVGAAEKIIVTIEYAATGAEGEEAARADGEFSVAFGDIVLNYSSVD